MNRLPLKTQKKIIQCLVEGNSVLATARIADVTKNSVLKLLVDAGRACHAYQDRVLRDLPCKRLQVDEIWPFIYAKQGNVPKAKEAPKGAGDAWTWTAICADTKLVPSWTVGDRSSETALEFMDDLRARLADRVQLTIDGLRAYLDAVEGAFGGDVDYAMLVKLYGSAGGSSPETRYSPGECNGIRKRKISGKPDPKHVSTSHAERSEESASNEYQNISHHGCRFLSPRAFRCGTDRWAGCSLLSLDGQFVGTSWGYCTTLRLKPHEER